MNICWSDEIKGKNRMTNNSETIYFLGVGFRKLLANKNHIIWAAPDETKI